VLVNSGPVIGNLRVVSCKPRSRHRRR